MSRRPRTSTCTLARMGFESMQNLVHLGFVDNRVPKSPAIRLKNRRIAGASSGFDPLMIDECL